MNTNPTRPTALLVAAAFLASTPLLVPSTATADEAASAARMKCHAHMSDRTPSQYSNVFVRVKTARRANATATAHYKTTKTTRHDRANRKGRASIKFYISGATPGREVDVKVTVSKKRRTSSCWTSFTPHR